MGAAALVPSSLAVLGTIYRDGSRKNLVFSLYAGGAPIGFPIGGAFSSLLAERASWPWVFYITAICCCMWILMAYFAIPRLIIKANGSTMTTTKPSLKFDWLGFVTGVSGLILFNFAWNRAPVVGWQSAQCIATLIIGLALMFIFFMVERWSPAPLIPVKQISSDAIFVLAIMALGWASFGVLIFYSFNFIMDLRGISPLLLVAQSMPVPFTGLSASLISSFLLTKGLRKAYLLGIALIFFCVGDIIVATMPIHQIYWKNTFLAFFFCPFGMDFSFPAATLIISNLVSTEHQGIAASLIATVVYYSQSIGLGIAGTVQTNVQGDDVLKPTERHSIHQLA